MTQYHIAFEKLPWEVPFVGGRHKILDQDGIRFRLVEYTHSMPPHWCERGHMGMILEGHMEIEFKKKSHSFHPGDAIYIPAGCAHQHRARVITEKALVFYIEEAPKNTQ